MKILAFTLALLTATAVLLSCANDSPAASSDSTTAVLLSYANDSTTVTTAVITPATTVDRDKLTLSDLSEEEIAFYRAVWAAVKDTVAESATINDLQVKGKYLKVDDVYMARYQGVRINGTYFTEGPAVTTVTVAGYDFIFGSTLLPSIFTDGKRYSLESAYSSGAVTELSYKYDEDGNVIEYIKTDAGKTEKYNYYFTEGRLVGETYETSITVSGETIPVTQNSTTVYTYDSDDALNCKYDTVVILSYAGQQTVYNLTGHKSYDERGELFSHAGEVASNVTVKSVTSDGATIKAAVADITYESNKYRYLYQEDKDFDGDGKIDSVIVKINTYSEWDELLSTERYLYDDYGNVLSYKQFNPTDNSVIYAEVNTVSPDAPRK